MTDYDAVLIYDGECPYCSVAAVALRRLGGVGAVSWYDDAAGAFLRAQFDAEPFAMVLADRRRGRVYAGRDAARELSDRAGVPAPVGGAVADNYDTIADAVGRLSGRDRDPAPVDGEYPMGEAAREAFPALARAAVDRADGVRGSDGADRNSDGADRGTAGAGTGPDAPSPD